MSPRLRSAVTVVASLMLPLTTGGCPPPPDYPADAERPVPSEGAPEPGAETPTPTGPATPATGGATGGATGPGSPAQVPAGGSETMSARPTDGPAALVYEKLRGGVWVPRCPACGEPLAEGVAACPGCRQPITAWRHEETCARCVGEGRCDHCGDDRACLTCDGDGKCASCAGTGAIGRGACPDCTGNKQCSSCRGDGRRDVVAGDFLPTEGWMPGACATCLDGAGLCPDCGATGRDRGGNVCVTCAGNRVCPDCAGEGTCTWCAADGDCPECAGGGRLVRNGAPRAADQRIRRLRTAAGSPLVARAEGPPTVQGARLSIVDGGRATSTTLPKSQLDPLSFVLIARDFPPGWDGRAAADPADVAQYRVDLALAAMDAGLWAPAMHQLRGALAIDPARAPSVRLQIADLEQRRAESWSKKVEDALRTGDRDRAIALLEAIVFAARGSALSKRAELQVLGLRKDRESEWTKLEEAERVRRTGDAKAAVDRTLARARLRLDRARNLVERAARGTDDLAADRTFARAEHAAWSARRLVQTTAARTPPAETPWTSSPESFVTESRLLSVSVLESWATRAITGGRFALGERLARRALSLDPANDVLKNLLAQAEMGRARIGVIQGSPPPGRR